MAKISITISIIDTSSLLPIAILIIVHEIKLQIIPCVIEYVKGINIIPRNAGIASSNFDQLIFRTGFIIKTPTKIKAGEVAIDGTTDRSGEKNIKGKNNNPATTAVIPVLPPCSTPAADSI